MTKQIDHDFYEKVVAYHMLTDESYLSTIVEHIKPEYFKNTNLKFIANLISEFHLSRNDIPSITELKAYLLTDDDRDKFRAAVTLFQDFDKNLSAVICCGAWESLAQIARQGFAL